MKNEKYNGYTNYETWAVALWVDNDQGTSEYRDELALNALRENDNNKIAASDTLAPILAEWITGENSPWPLPTEGLAADLCRVDKVNWHELAETWLEDYDNE